MMASRPAGRRSTSPIVPLRRVRGLCSLIARWERGERRGVDTGGGDPIVKVNMVGTINFVEAFLPYLEEGSALVNYCPSRILRAAHARGARDLG